MESASSAKVTLDISFGLDDPNFSDRTLLLEIIGEADTSNQLRNVKRRRSDDLLKNATTLSPPKRLKTMHVTSLILAARSPFFRKLFSNGMQESAQKHVTLKIEAFEEASFMDLLKFIYNNKLPTTFDALLDLSVTADKFEVESCSKGCTRALQKWPMTCELASNYLDLPPSLLMSPTIRPLIKAAKKFLVAKFKDLSKFKEELLNLPLLSLKAIISKDDLRVKSEIEVYDFVLEWVAKHYPDLKERQEILKEHLLHLVRFPCMTTTELIEKVQTCSDIDPDLSSKIVLRALCFKTGTDSYRKRCLAAEEGNTSSCQFVRRAHIHRPIKVVELESPHPQCVVYLDLTRNELKHINREGKIWSETFYLDCRELNMCIERTLDRLNFRLFLNKSESSTCTIKCEFAVRRKPQDKFKNWNGAILTFTKTKVSENLHSVNWTHFISHDRYYFINDILHLRAELTIEK